MGKVFAGLLHMPLLWVRYSLAYFICRYYG